MNIQPRKIKYLGLLLALFSLVILSTPACSPKSGCPATESLQAQTKKAEKGKINKKKKKSGLFPKEVSKKAKIRQ
jgi:hypothetical protein